jgi:nitrate/nitrite transport system substrate-binding protein
MSISLNSQWPTATTDVRCSCGGNHFPQDHWEFLESMPQDPTDWVNDLIKMGVYKSNALDLANNLTQVEMREALLLKQIGGGNPAREAFCKALIKEAGGLDQAMAAAFGVNATEFFSNTIRNSDFSRREFLKRVAVAGALVAMASCAGRDASAPTDASTEAVDTSNLEKTDLRIGFIPITCATPIVMSEPLGFYDRYGLDVTLVRMPNWAAVRDSAIAGELDAYHMLSPMPIAITMGLGSTAFPINLASIENINGQAITIASKHQGNVQGPEDFRGFRIGVPFPYSMHNLLIRYYLATGGLNPDTDVQIVAVPPPDSVANMTVGEIDAMLMPDPFNQRAVYEGVGFIHRLTKDLWNGHPCCAFAASQDWIDANPNTFRVINKVIIDAAIYADAPTHRAEIAEALIQRQYLNQPLPVVEAVLTGNFEDGQGNTLNVPDRIGFDPYPWKSFAKWIASQMVRWDFMPAEIADYDQIAQDIFLTDLAAELQRELGHTPPAEVERVETLLFDSFDPSDPAAYVEQQIQQFNV